MDEILTMSQKELTRLEIMQKLDEGRMRQADAANLLGLCARQVRRLLTRYRRQGAAGLVSRRRGQPSNHRLDPTLVQAALDQLKGKYQGFGPTLAHEKLTELHGLDLSRESLRQLMISEGLWKAKRAKQAVVHQLRERRACFGELVQIDGSPHAWFEERGPKCSLLVFVDDATGQLLELWFAPSETFFAYCEATRHYLERYGKPVAFYTDKHGIFRVNQPRPLGMTSGITQFGRAMEELDIQIVCANTPQAKGRIERVNQTLQDRLVKELRLRNIRDQEAGNAYLPQFREDFNRRFAVPPRSTHDAHRRLAKTDMLDLALSHQVTRTLSRNLTVQANNVIYQIHTQRPSYALRNAQVMVCENPQGKITILYKGQTLAYTVFTKPVRQAQVVNTKTLGHILRTPKTPATDHPWRRYGHSIKGKPILPTQPSGSG